MSGGFRLSVGTPSILVFIVLTSTPGGGAGERLGPSIRMGSRPPAAMAFRGGDDAALSDTVRIEVERAQYDPRSPEGRRIVQEAPRVSGARAGPPGWTSWEIRPRWRPTVEDGVCVPRQVEVDVRITIRLPSGVSLGLSGWLRRHEEGHRRIVEEHAVDVHGALVQLQAATCAALQSRADRLFERMERDHAARHTRFDGGG